MRRLTNACPAPFTSGNLLCRSVVFVILFAVIGIGTSLAAQPADDPFSEPPTGAAPGTPAKAPAAPAAPNTPAATPAAPATPNAPAPTGNAPAPNTPNADAANAPGANNYLVWMMKSLGWFFSPVFIFLSMTMVALVVMNALSIRRSNLVPPELVRRFGVMLDEGKYQDAYQTARNDESLLGKVLASGLSRMSAGYDKASQAMQDVAQEETMRLEHQIGYLALIGNLAPMIGLFGTVVGMIDAFQVIAAGGSAPSPQKLAEGIATAMFTTMVGLAIALPSLAIYDILRNRLARFTLEIGIVSDNFMSRFSAGAPKK